MARTVKDTNLQTREARERLKARHNPYWRTLDPGAHLGYRKGTRGGVWIARWRHPDGKYRKRRIGNADDKADADGNEIFDWSDAQERARELFAEWRARAEGKGPVSYKVRDAIEDYVLDYRTRGRGLRTMQYSIDAHILPALGGIEVSELTYSKIKQWHRRLAETPARLRSGRFGQQRYRPEPQTPDHARRRKVTANKILTILRSALNHAFAEGQVADDKPWRRVKPFHNVDAPRIRYLSEVEAVRLINACDEDFRQLVKAALLSAARYGELIRLQCADFNSDVGSLHLRETKSGKPRDATLTDEGINFFRQVTAGKSGDALVFLRSDETAWGKSHQKRRLEDACERAKVSPAISFHILRHCAGSWLAMKGTPMAVIAQQLGHADERMAERHYAHLAPHYVKETIRKNFPTLGIVSDENVVPMPAHK